MYFSYVVVNCNGRTRNPFRRSESKQRPFCLQAQVWLLPLYFNILTDTGFLLMIPTCCQSWRLNRTNTTCCMFAWRNVSAAVTLKTCRSAWQPPINVTNNIPRYLRRENIFCTGALFFWNNATTVWWMKNICVTADGWDSLSLLVSLCCETNLAPSINNDYWLTKMAFYCMWCHPKLKLAWALYGGDKSGHVQKKPV